MGRKKLNRTPDEIREQWRKRSQRYYERNKDQLNAKRLERYYRSKATKEDVSQTLQSEE